MDVSTLKRDSAKVLSAIKETQDGRLIAVKPLTVYFPRRWEGPKLAIVGETSLVTSIFVIVTDDGFYGVPLYLGMMKMKPTSVKIVDIDGSDYFGFYFESGATLTESTELLKDDKLPYKTFDEIMAKGNVPWYMSEEDLAKLFMSTKKANGLTLAGTNVPFEVMVAAMARSPKDVRKYYRHTVKTEKDLASSPQFISLSNVLFGPTNTVAEVMGNRFDDGLMAALTNPTERVEGIEALLRH